MATSFLGCNGDVIGPSLEALHQGVELRGEALGCKHDRNTVYGVLWAWHCIQQISVVFRVVSSFFEDVEGGTQR